MNVISLIFNLKGCKLMPNHAYRLRNGKLSHQYLDKIADLESRIGGYGAVNKSSIDLGRYQMSGGALQDANMKNKTGQWTGKFGVYSNQDFLKNKEAQEHAMDWYTAKNAKVMKNHKSYSYAGREIDGIKKRFKITRGGLDAAAHRQGATAVRDYLRHMNNNNMKSDFSKLLKKDQTKFERIETRLREFEGIKSWK